MGGLWETRLRPIRGLDRGDKRDVSGGVDIPGPAAGLCLLCPPPRVVVTSDVASRAGRGCGPPCIDTVTCQQTVTYQTVTCQQTVTHQTVTHVSKQ